MRYSGQSASDQFITDALGHVESERIHALDCQLKMQRPLV